MTLQSFLVEIKTRSVQILGVNYTKDQIEQKRLLALQRKAEKDAQFNRTNNSSNSSSWYNSAPGISSPKLNSPARQNKSLNLIQYEYKKDPCGAMRSPKSYSNRPTPIEPKKFFAPVTILTGTCTMITENRFMVDVEYHQKLIEEFKTIPSKLYGLYNFLILLFFSSEMTFFHFCLKFQRMSNFQIRKHVAGTSTSRTMTI